MVEGVATPARVLKNHLEDELPQPGSARFGCTLAQRVLLEERLAQQACTIKDLEEKLAIIQPKARAARDAAYARDLKAEDALARLDIVRQSCADERDERERLSARVHELNKELDRKDRAIHAMRQRLDQRESDLLAEGTAVEVRTAHRVHDLNKELVNKSFNIFLYVVIRQVI